MRARLSFQVPGFLGCWVRGCSVGDLGCHFAGVAPCWLHPATHTNVLGFKGPWYGAGVRRWLHPLADASARWSLMCALWLHHGDHSLALLSWVAATPGQKKKPYPRLLASFTPVCALLAAPHYNEAMHHCDPGMVLPCGVRCWLPASQCLGLGLGAPFRLSLLLPSV